MVHMARLDAELEIAWLAVDVPRMQRVLAEKTSLRRAMYGQPQA